MALDLDRLRMPAMASLTLGLAPWLPEPHIVGKIRWVLGGAVDMGAMDWWDLAMHGAPWLWLTYTLATMLLRPKALPAPALEPGES